ncbi:tail fiber domain-containing protein [Marinihelvus fidelis]|uniref:Tail fiber domain-containing protein n=1 Tax=Marinihelvus fidelis TaxID=2613842 RepID=A0A5N0TE58_9GAMM|nr:tail fiber domain-containing protein [Marinihelvus fidelis]KAA9133383.1 tail fiber domain-containing protein [Marinihelvus fidelis]
MRTPSKKFLASSIALAMGLGATSAYAQVLNGDHIVEGQLCASQSNLCTNPESYPTGPSLNADFKAKDDYPMIYLEDNGDTDWSLLVDWDATGSYFPRGSFAIGRTPNPSTNYQAYPFVIQENAPNRSLYIGSSGRIGMGTSAPTEELEISSFDPTIALFDVDGVTWEINSNSNSTIFDIANATAGTSPFVLESGAPSNALRVDNAGNVGFGVGNPARQVHLSGTNAVFRMDRPSNTAAFMIVRTDGGGTPMKTYVLGTNASDVNNGEFVINDLGTAVGGPGSRRMTIQNDGSVVFTGVVSAPNFISPSSRKLKENIEDIDDPIGIVNRLHGVKFDWIESGEPALGFIAEEVAEVLPDIAAHDKDTGEVAGMSYVAVIPILVEALKAQQLEIAGLREELERIESVEGRLALVESMLIGQNTEPLLVKQ